MNRRRFLERSALTAGSLLASHSVWVRSLAAATPQSRNLVLIELDGGNDGLNTVVPYGIDRGLYHSLYRPSLGIPTEKLLVLDERFGLNPALAPLLPLYSSGKLAIVLGVGSPEPTFSHDFAKKVWATGEPSGELTSGWVGRYLNELPGAKSRAFDVGNFANRVFGGAKQLVPAFPGLSGLKFPIDKKHPEDGAARELAYRAIHEGLALEDSPRGEIARTGALGLGVADEFRKIDSVKHSALYPKHEFAEALQLVARVLSSKLGLRIHHVAFPSFDTHARQDEGFSHDQKLAVLAKSLSGFRDDLKHLGLASKTLVVVYSEFGRSLFENASRGTDHGTAAPVLVLGESVAGGLYGEQPSLLPENLSAIQEMVATVDYRDVLGTVATRWLETAAGPLLPGHSVTDLGFLK